MKYLFRLIPVLFFIPLLSEAQVTYKPGYLVNNHNDTTKGFVDYHERFNSPKVFNFRKTIDSQIEKFSIADLKAVGITGYDYFEKFVAPVSKGYISLSQLSDKVDSSFTTDTVFLRLVKKGKYISLYSYTDEIKTRFYVINEADKKVTELNYYVYLDEETHSTVPLYNYRLQLLDFTYKYQPDKTKEISNLLRNTPYDEGGFLKVVQAINGSNDRQAATKSLFTTRFFIGASAQNNNLNFIDAPKTEFGSPQVFFNGTHKNAVSPSISVGVDALLNKETQNLVLRAEVSFISIDYTIKNQRVDGDQETNSAYATLNLKENVITVEPQVIYNFYSGKNLKAFLGIGLGANMGEHNNYNYTLTRTTTGGLVYSTDKNLFPNVKSFWFTVPIKAGILLERHFEIYASYTPSTVLTDGYTGFSASVTTYRAGLNYLFGK